jgi:zinc D-Ala-D-Ala carboxypeptidase
MDNISAHISYAEATHSNTAIANHIDNTPNAEQLTRMQDVAITCFEPLRAWHDDSIGIDSFFRCIPLNRLVRGADTSQHCKGEAIDINAHIFNNGVTNKQLFDWLRNNVEFDQLIWEFGTVIEPSWVHISYHKEHNRKQCLKSISNNGTTQYITI